MRLLGFGDGDLLAGCVVGRRPVGAGRGVLRVGGSVVVRVSMAVREERVTRGATEEGVAEDGL
jgi:hypothetical protein